MAFFVAGGILFKSRTLKNTTLAVLLILIGIHILLFLYGSGWLAILYPQFRSWFYYEVAFILGPTLYFHRQCVFINKQRLIWTDTLHLLPILLFWFDHHDVLFMDVNLRDAYISENFMTRTMFWNYVLAFQMILYGIMGLYILYSYRTMVQNHKLTHVVFFVLPYLSSTTLIVFLTHFALGWRDFEIYYLGNTIFIFGVGYLLYTNPQFFEQIRKKYFSSNLEINQMVDIDKKIKTTMHEQQLFLNNDLSIDSLANTIEEKPYHVSKTFSAYIHEGFSDYVNKQRIEEAKKMLKDPTYKKYKIEAIAFECGFNNKVSFYKAFAKFTNVTPAKFRKSKKM